MKNSTEIFRPEIHIPGIISHTIAVIFGIPLNGYLILELTVRASRRKLPKYAYCILSRCVVDLLIIFPRVINDLMQATDDFLYWIPSTIQQTMELYALMLDLITVTIWKIKSKSAALQDKLILGFVPVFTTLQSVFIVVLAIIGDVDQAFWEFWGPIIKTTRMMVFCVIYIAYFVSVRQPDHDFLTPFVIQSHQRVVRFFLIDIIVLFSIIVCLCGRWLTVILWEGTLSWRNPFYNIAGTGMDLYWYLTVVYPAIRAAATIWSFPQLLRNAFT